MSDHPKNPDEKPGWADKPKNVQRIWYGLIAICVLLFFADFFVEKHPYFDIENVPNFYGFYGFVGCVVLVLAAAQMRKVIMRDEDYYEKKDAEYERRNFGRPVSEDGRSDDDAASGNEGEAR